MRNIKHRYGANDERIRRRLQNERFVLPEGSSFYDLYEQRAEANVGELINIALEAIETANREKLEGVFRNIDFNSEANLGKTRDRNRQPENAAGGFQQTRIEHEPQPRFGRRHRQHLYLPDRAFRLRRGEKSRRILHAAQGVRTGGEAVCSQARSPHLRSRLRFCGAAD